MMTTVLYNVVESVSRGKIVVANTDILPGQVITREEEPLLHFDRDFLQIYLDYFPYEFALALACFKKYKNDLSEESRLKFASLFGPTTGHFAEEMRRVAKLIIAGEFKHEVCGNLCVEDVEDFVKAANVMRLNMFGSPTADSGIVGWAIFCEVTRFAHSCDPNCVYELETKTCTCRAKRHIRKGEEMTISYNGPRDKDPTHIRRHKYLEMKEFTCHCPRCDAPGDDTRQFDCCHPTCKGVMMVCQPLNKEPVLVPDRDYTDVEYVEPHLLPCTECHHAAPPEYQAKMLALEPKLAKLVEELSSSYETLADAAATWGYDAIKKEIEDAQFPLRHLLCLPILRTRLKLCRWYFMSDVLDGNLAGVVKHRAKVQKAAGEYIAALESVFPHPNVFILRVLKDVCAICIYEWLETKLALIFPPQEAKALLQRTLRMELLLGGRRESEREADVDSALLKMMTVLPPAVCDMQVCAFCEESPLRAALTLKQCGKCKKVMYCSAGCQKAHWKLHKKTCKAA